MTIQNSNQYYKTNQLDGLSALEAKVYNHSFPKHYHDTYQITLTKSGVFKNQIDHAVLHALEGQISITHPNEVHATLCDEICGHSFFTLYLPPSLFDSDHQPQFNSVIDDHEIKLLLNHIHAAFSNSEPLELLTLQLTQSLLKQHQINTSHQPFSVNEQFDLTLLIQDNNKFNLSNWAKKFELDKFKFLRLFKQQTGMTPNQYLIFQRIKNSQSLLADGVDLTDTALECGFYDLPHFHKHFRKITGITPHNFQQAHNN